MAKDDTDGMSEKIRLLCGGELKSTYELATRLGVPQRTAHSVMHGTNKPQRKTLERIARALGVSVEYLTNDAIPITAIKSGIARAIDNIYETLQPHLQAGEMNVVQSFPSWADALVIIDEIESKGYLEELRDIVAKLEWATSTTLYDYLSDRTRNKTPDALKTAPSFEMPAMPITGVVAAQEATESRSEWEVVDNETATQSCAWHLARVRGDSAGQFALDGQVIAFDPQPCYPTIGGLIIIVTHDSCAYLKRVRSITDGYVLENIKDEPQTGESLTIPMSNVRVIYRVLAVMIDGINTQDDLPDVLA